jgi:5-methylcytosine-specific restriction endonuclease McrA
MDTTNLPKTRAEAKAQGAKYYFTGEPCRHGHIAPRKTKGACIECLKLEWQQAAENRAEYFREYNRREDVKDRKNVWYLENREQVIEAASTRPAHVKREYQQAWKERNQVWVRADTKARRRKHREATPPWLTRKQKSAIRQLYQIAITNSRITGEQYVVDHIYPLRSDVVCGLHVPWNLRVITQQQNLQKSNTLPEDGEALAFPPKP